MQMESATRKRIVRDASVSLLIYASPVVAMLGTLWATGQRPWLTGAPTGGLSQSVEQSLGLFSSYGLPLFMIALGLIEFALGAYERHWDSNERALDLACFVIPRFVTRPLTRVPWAAASAGDRTGSTRHVQMGAHRMGIRHHRRGR